MDSNRTEAARIGKSLVIKGELSGSEDLYVDGEIEGSIQLQQNILVVGPNGKLKAGVTAGKVVVHGTLEGNLQARDQVELKKTSLVTGDIVSQRISIEDGAYFKGRVDIQRDGAQTEAAKPSTQTAAAEQVGDSALTKA